MFFSASDGVYNEYVVCASVVMRKEEPLGWKVVSAPVVLVDKYTWETTLAPWETVGERYSAFRILFCTTLV